MADDVKPIPLGFTKLVVGDLDKMSSFYRSVCGLIEEGRDEDKIGDRTFREVFFRSDPPGTGTFVLLQFVGCPRPAGQGVLLGFVADDIDRFMERAVAAGAAVIEAAHPRPEHGVKVAYATDIEGNLIEVVEIIKV